jgi:hypothetical protein
MPPAYAPSSLTPPALALLVEAVDNAIDVGCELWDFALSIDSLAQAGLSITAIQWLIAKGHLLHKHEFTPPGDDERVFRLHGKWNFGRRSRFVLTPAGAQFARSILASHGTTARPSSALAGAWPPQDCPVWDGRRLSYRGEVLMELSRPAPNERAVLDRFQKLGWLPRIDDPLPPETVGNPKRRLHNTINALNRKQAPWRITLSGDGTGRGVCWRPRDNP